MDKNIKKRTEYYKKWSNKPENKEKIRLKVLLWGRKNTDKQREYRRKQASKWYHSHKEQRRVYNYARDKRHRDAGKLSVETLQLVYENNIKQYLTLTCVYCLKPIKFGDDSLEHIVPLIKGGANNIENLAVACRSCNSSKGSKTLLEFKEYLEIKIK
jgi:5-methylcytosine-specific restriction endonuclease McrA